MANYDYAVVDCVQKKRKKKPTLVHHFCDLGQSTNSAALGPSDCILVPRSHMEWVEELLFGARIGNYHFQGALFFSPTIFSGLFSPHNLSFFLGHKTLCL